MRKSRVTIASLLGLILLCGIFLAGLRSGSNDWVKLTYSLTFLSLVYAAIAARYRGAFWYGFAVAGWAYFVIGFGPWINTPLESTPPPALNANLLTSVVLQSMANALSENDSPMTFRIGALTARMVSINDANRIGIGHCALTMVFGLAGGLVAKFLVRQATNV